MAPKKRSAGAGLTKTAKPKPRLTEVPKLIIAGGIEVLSVKTGPDSVTQIEAFLNPRMGMDATTDWYGYSDNVTVASAWETDVPPRPQLPCYSMAKIQLPMLNEDITCGTILMWEAVSVKTEVVGINTLANCHSNTKRQYDSEGVGLPVQGLNYHFFSVGGEPLDVQFICSNHLTTYPSGTAHPNVIPKTATALDPTLKATLVEDNAFPIEAWCPDPAKNENSRYFGSMNGGLTTPPVLQFTNTVTTILLNENGVGPLCKGDNLFLAAADIVGFATQYNNKTKFRGLPRYFNVTLRKRIVKNPYPVSSLLNTLFSRMQPQIRGQDMQHQVEEVRVYDGTEELPGDPDMIRYRDQYGDEHTEIPEHN
ncbi:minor capsid protein VP1 [Myotis horsfieldii polyomavirus 3]|nr:minor capsid protein VP1 [Myotis horsfieldii polyomavirus 3]BBG62021.1 minor capsid protein VP1 [Rhinolophus affinis polyomavirus 3]BBG62027.1 minor capsid protein VP1 [Rhinolophus affinis polyomavirus 3]BBG62033.1 minor capsid protein VP1 [Rhinolophus affinis polyomavirus 3]BBG62045.1 minor capsid protein VP1 [Rhinolophus affinis polyomavirus 3]